MRSISAPVGPLVAAVCVVGAVTACSSPEPAGSAASSTPGASLASSSAPAGSDSGSGGNASAQVPVGPDDPQPTRGGVEVIRTLPHDETLFTQGLEVAGDRIYESTGQYGHSQVQHRTIDAETPTARVPMAADEFGEGLTLTPDTLWTLTWKKGIAHERDPQTLEVRSEVPYEGEGWGLCHDGDHLVMSDGSDELTFRDPETFEPTGTVSVTSGGTPVPRLNELECRDGTVLANVWMSDEIVRIDPATGAVTAIHDASGLQQPRPSDPDAVLNGIAALPDSDTVLLTGKLWDEMYEVRLVG